jgi:alpha-beta hydrolase superfamily lysophospholipase
VVYLICEETSYIGYDGMKMYLLEWTPDNSKCDAVVLAIHGMTMHSGQMVKIGEYLSNRGVGVLAPDMRGFGHYQGLKGHVDDYEEFMMDLSSLLDQVRERFPDEKIYMLGHSLGGLHTINFVLRNPHALNGIILSAPAVSEKAKISKGKRLVARLISAINLKKHFAAGVNAEDMAQDPEIVESIKNDSLRFKFMTARFGISVQNAMKIAASSAAQILVPVLFLQGGEDKLVDPLKASNFFDDLKVDDKTWKMYDNLYHTLPQVKDNEQVLQDIFEWVDVRSKSA